MQVLSVSVGWHLASVTHDPMTLGLVGLAQFGPMFALTLFAGDVADRYQRRLILVISFLVEAFCAGLLVAAVWNGETRPWIFYAILVIFGCARAFSGPASQSFLPQIVSSDRLPQAISVSSSVMQVAVISGPALGGLALQVSTSFAFGISLILFSVVSAVLYGIRIENLPERPVGAATVLERVIEGVAFVRKRRELLGAISLDLFAVLLGGATALLPFFAQDVLHVGPAEFGWLRASPAIGAATMSFWLTARPLGRYAGAKMFASVALFGVATIVFALSENFFLSMACLITLGAADMVSVNVRHSLTTLATPDHMRGRVSAVNMLFIGASNELGEFESGITAAWWGTIPAVIVGGAGTLAVVGLWAWMFPELRKVDRLSDLKPT
jgi:hypothetical protein